MATSQRVLKHYPVRLRVLALVILAVVLSAPAFAAAPTPAPIAPYTTASGQTRSTAGLRGHRTVLWLLSTWCGSCAAGLQTMDKHAPLLEKAGLRVVILRNYENGGYPGRSVEQFVDRIAPRVATHSRWTLGQASRALEKAYNPRHYPDIYFLINASGHIQGVDGAPAATIGQILQFARGGD